MINNGLKAIGRCRPPKTEDLYYRIINENQSTASECRDFNYDAARKTKKDGRIYTPPDRKTAFFWILKVDIRLTFMTDD